MSECLYGCSDPTRCNNRHAGCAHCRAAREAVGQPAEGPSQAPERDVATELDELRATFQLRWDADMRAIKRWQAAHPGNELVWPDHADLVVWLMDQLLAAGGLHG